MKGLKFHEFQAMLVNSKLAELEMERRYVDQEVRKQFHKLIKHSAKYSKSGKLVIPASKLLEANLGLGVRIDGRYHYYTFSTVFKKFLDKCRNEKYAAKVGVKPLQFEHK